MLSERATFAAHGLDMSLIMQVGRGTRSLRHCSIGWAKSRMASKKFTNRSMAGTRSRFSQPTGRPASAQGKGSSTKFIGSLDSCTRAMMGLMRDAFTGVVMKVTRTPRSASSRAMSSMGIVCPCAISGTRTT